MNRRRMINLLLAVTAAVLLTPLANADSLDVTLENANPTVVQSATETVVQFFGIVSNPSTTDTIYVNTDATSSDPGTTVDDSLFEPFGLLPGSTTGEFEIFDVDLDPGLGPGTYSGFFSFLGGPDGGTFTDYDDLADINFSITVTTPVTATPEPGTLALLISALAVGMLLCWRVKLNA